jgi:chromosome segregation ATPase
MRDGTRCRSPPSRSAAADGEDRSMAHTEQAWDWGVELRDEERSELEHLRRTVGQLRTQLDQAHEALRSCSQRHQDASQALRQLAEAGPWRRRRVLTSLRERQLL